MEIFISGISSQQRREISRLHFMEQIAHHRPGMATTTAAFRTAEDIMFPIWVADCLSQMTEPWYHFQIALSRSRSMPLEPNSLTIGFMASLQSCSIPEHCCWHFLGRESVSFLLMICRPLIVTNSQHLASLYLK